MASTAMSLGTLLCTNREIAYYTQESIRWNNLYEGNLDKLEEQVRYEEKHCEAYDKCYYAEDDKKVKRNGKTYENNNECVALQYADEVVRQYNEELKNELAELDVEYDTMKTMLDTKLETLRARQEAEKSLVQQNSQNTELVNS